jgi:hypothetical protein
MGRAIKKDFVVVFLFPVYATMHILLLRLNSFFEIEDRIKIFSDAEYRQMQINMQPLAEKISKGQFLSDAIDEIMKLV